MYENPETRRGRGAQSNVSGRYEPLQRVDFDDGWSRACESDLNSRTCWRDDTARSIITRNQSPDIPFDRSINPYRGCEHGCVYCYARPSHTWLGHSAGLDFERLLYVKRDAAGLLKNELARPGYQVAPVAVGVNTDAWQPLERKLGITRQILEVLLEARHPLYLITKSSLIERDMDLLHQFADQNLLSVCLTITTLDNELSSKLEPRATAPHRRLRTLRTLADAGIPVRVSVSPVIPALNEHELEDIVTAAADAGATAAHALLLRLPHELAQLFPEWLEAHYPLRRSRVLKAIRSMRNDKLNNSEYGDRFRGNGPRADFIHQRFEAACRRHKLDYGRENFSSLDCSAFVVPTGWPNQVADSRYKQQHEGGKCEDLPLQRELF
ncbi:MAG: PA0069 family radical SAM protein [Granulosicoccus sp.]